MSRPLDVLLATHPGEPFADQDDEVLRAALVDRGVAAAVAAWSDPTVDWSAARAVVIRSTWDYTERLDQFLGWTRQVAATTALWNPADVVAWNTRKDYLLTLEERGAPIVPTAWLGKGDPVDLAALLADHGWDDAVVKPVVGAGSQGLLRVTGAAAHVDAQAHLDGLLRDGDAMVQPFQDSVVTDGELSIVLFEGEVSHAVRKRVADGEIRVQVEFGGQYRAEDPDPDAAALARWIVQATGHDLLFARVDLLAAPDGAWQLAELEATEPSLYLRTVPEAADRLAEAIQRRLDPEP